MEERFTQPEGWIWGRLVNADGGRLRYGSVAQHQSPVANVIMVGGLSEFAEKYFETIRDLGAIGYNCYFMDTMGQGGSGRYLSDQFKRHSKGFDRDERDLLQFVKTCVPDNAPKVILAHSMGSLLSLMTIRNNPDQFHAAVLIAPLLGFEDFPAKGFEWFLAKFPFSQNFMESYIPGGGPWQPRSQSHNFPEMYSSDPDRMLLHDEWMESTQEIRVGNPTNGVIIHASRVIMALRSQGAIESIKTPLKIFSAGKDFRVSNKAIYNMAARVQHTPKNKDPHVDVSSAKHDILMEKNSIRTPVLIEIDKFFRAQL